MAYKLNTQQILPQGLNLLSPGDSVASGDCLDLANWWPGAAGKLEQAPSFMARNSSIGLLSQDSLCSADGRIYFGGAGSLRQIGRDGGGTALATGFDGTPLGMISYQGYCWIMNRSATRAGGTGTKGQCKDDGTTTTDWSPAAPGIATLQDGGIDGTALTPDSANPPEVGGLLNSEYGYYTTWQLGTLGETNPSPVATITPAVDLSIVRVTRDVAPPANATGWNIYRKSPTFSGPYRLNEFTLDIARTYVDDYGNEVHTHSDTQLLQLGILMEADHDAAPPARVIADQVYNGRILVASSAAHPNRIWFTPALQPGFFRGSANENDGDWVDCGTDKGDAILAMICHPGMTIIYRQRSIWRNTGDFGADNGGQLDVVVPDVGTVGVRGVIATSLGDYFIGPDGLYKFNNDWAAKISPKVEPVFRGQATENLPTLGTANRSQCAIGHHNGRLWVSYPNSSGVMIHSLIYDILSTRWFNASQAWGAFLDTGSEFLGAGPGVFALESTYGTGTSLMAFQSEYQDCGLPDHEKTWADLVINHNTQGVVLTVTARKNRNTGGTVLFDEWTLATIASTALTKSVIPLVAFGSYPAGQPELGTAVKAFNLSIRITGTGAGVLPIVIETPMLLHYYVEARKGKSFDSDETDHGMVEVKTVDQVEFDIDAPFAGALLQVYSDAPGGRVIPREGAGQAIPQTVGRQAQRIVLSTPADGRLLRYTATSPNTVQIYGVRARVLPIGEYLDGTIGDTWQPQPISIGV